MPLSAWLQFGFVMGLGVLVAGLTTYVMSWALVGAHLRDHHPAARQRLGSFLFAPHAFGWYLARRWRTLGDRSLAGLARLGTIGAWGMVLGLLLAIATKTIASTQGITP